MGGRTVVALAAVLLASSAAGQQAEPKRSETLQRYIEYAGGDAERQRKACEMAIADYRAQCPIRGGNPHFQSPECAQIQDYIRNRCDAKGKDEIK